MAEKKKPADIVWNIVIAALAACIISMGITYFANGRSFAKMNLFGYRLSYVMSESMEPTILTHAVCLTHVGTSDIKKGDIVVYQHDADDKEPTLLIIHRVQQVNDDGSIITKGDNNPDADPWTTPKDHIIGKVVGWSNTWAKVFG